MQLGEANEVRQRRPGTAADQSIPKHPVEISFPELDAKDATPIDIVITIPARKCASKGYTLLEWLVDEFAASLTGTFDNSKVSYIQSSRQQSEISHNLHSTTTVKGVTSRILYCTRKLRDVSCTQGVHYLLLESINISFTLTNSY